MVNSREGAIRTTNWSASGPQSLKGLGAGDFVNEVTIDVDQSQIILLLGNDVIVPNFVVQSAGLLSRG